LKKFQFRLQVVLDIKEKLLEQKLLELSKVQRGLQDAVNKQKTLEGYQAEINEALLNTQGFKKRLHRLGGSKSKITLRGKNRE